MPSQANKNNSVRGRMKSLPGSSGILKRCPERVSILLIGSTGDGKSATINHLLDTDTVKTGSFEPETKETVEYLLAIKNQDNEDSYLKLSIIDTPGLNDPRGLKQDACNLHSMKYFFETHPHFSKSECYPNLIFLVISANEHRIGGSDSKLANIFRALKELKVVDKHHPNVVAVLTFCCSVAHNNVSKWVKTMEEKQDTISRNIDNALGIKAPVVLLENDRDSNNLEKDGVFTLLPNETRQPKNLYKVCQEVLNNNGDHYGLSTFNVGLAHHGAKKQYNVAYHKVIANDSTSSKYQISEIEEDLLIILGGSLNAGKGVMRKKGSGTNRSESELIGNPHQKSRWPSVTDILSGVFIVLGVIVVIVIVIMFEKE